MLKFMNRFGEIIWSMNAPGGNTNEKRDPPIPCGLWQEVFAVEVGLSHMQQAAAILGRPLSPTLHPFVFVDSEARAIAANAV